MSLTNLFIRSNNDPPNNKIGKKLKTFQILGIVYRNILILHTHTKAENTCVICHTPTHTPLEAVAQLV